MFNKWQSWGHVELRELIFYTWDTMICHTLDVWNKDGELPKIWICDKSDSPYDCNKSMEKIFIGGRFSQERP